MVQVIEMTEREKYDMYMKLEKSEIVKMLIESNRQLDRVVNTLPIYHVSQQSELVCPTGYYPNHASTGLECVHCGRGKYAH